jgi:hypothetical protein
MVIDDLYVPSLTIMPIKTYPPLLVDADAVLARAVAVKSFQTVAGRCPQIVKPISRIYRQKLCASPPLNLMRQITDGVACKDRGRTFIGKGLDHRGRAYR